MGKPCFTFYHLGDLDINPCPQCGSCDYSFQMRIQNDAGYPVKRLFYSVVCNRCNYASDEVERELGTSESTVLIIAVWVWNGW